MDMKFLIKLGVGLLGAYLIFQWFSNAISSAQYTPGDNGLYSPSFAAPLAWPGPVTGTYYQWQRPWRPGRRR